MAVHIDPSLYLLSDASEHGLGKNDVSTSTDELKYSFEALVLSTAWFCTCFSKKTALFLFSGCLFLVVIKLLAALLPRLICPKSAMY